MKNFNLKLTWLKLTAAAMLAIVILGGCGSKNYICDCNEGCDCGVSCYCGPKDRCSLDCGCDIV